VVGATDVIVFTAAFVALIQAGPLGSLAILGVWIVLWGVGGLVLLFRKGAWPRYLRFNSRRLAFVLLFWIWFAFVARTYVGEFFNYHPIAGFLNQPLIELPCFDYIPGSLERAAANSP
jgi:hypothetical protein